MKAHFDIIQGTEAWHEMRYGKIGGSTSKGLFVHSDTLLDEMLSQHLEPFELEDDGYVNSDMQRGIELEPLACAQVSQYAGISVINCGWIQSEIPLLGISPDRISQDLTVAIEVKCPNKKRHTTTIRERQIPLDNLFQAVHYFTVNPLLKSLYWGSFRPESKKPLFVQHLTLESAVNLGTRAKPVVKTVAEWTGIAKEAANSLQRVIDNEIKLITGI